MARAARSVVVFIFALHLLFTAQAQTGKTVTCDIPSVEPLANTSVTCHFPENVNQTRRIVTVSFYKGAQYTVSNENEILLCWWMSGKMDCDVQRGYKFNRIISHELTLEIPQVSTKHIGGYACKLSNMNRNDITYCELKIKLEGKTMCDVPPVPLNSRTSLTCYFPEDLSKNTADFSVYHQSSRRDSVNVMSCKRTGEHRFCNTIRGYEFDQTVTNHLTVGIPNAQEDQEGSYSCHYTSSSPVRYENCSLTWKTVTSFCNISSVVETEPASLTCTFNVDVSATKNNFSLVRIGGADSKAVDIVTCTWLKDQLKCTTAPAYEVNNTVTDHLVIRVPRASRDQTGTYVCHVNGSKASGFQPCEFIPKPVTSFCNISSVVETEPASLTCTFNVDVNATKNNFSLVRIGGADSKGVDIVTCTWLKDQLKCTTAPGYEVNNTVTDHLVIRVPRASRDHTGTYACHVNGSKANGFQSCEFIVRPVTSFCNISSIKETKPASLTCTFNVDVNATKSNLSLVRLGGDDSKVYSSVYIVTCTWLEDQLKCTTAPGYEVNNLVTDHLVIRVPRASRDHTGTYACHVTGSSMDGFKSCDFIVIPDVPAVVLTVAIAVLVFIPVSLVIVFLGFKCKQRIDVATEDQIPLMQVLSREELESRAKQEEEFWKQWVEAAFPDLDSSVYFLPPVHLSRVPTTQESVAGQTVLVLQSSPQVDESNQTVTTAVKDSDVRHDAAMQRVLLCLETMFKENREVVVGVSQLLFDDYLRDSRYADVARRLPLPVRHHSDLRQEWKPGDIDVILINRQYGLVICKMSAYDGKVNEHSELKKERAEKTHTEIKNNLQEAIKQLNRAGTTVSYVALDVAHDLRVTKTIALPNLTVSQLQQVLDKDPELTQDLCRCLGTTDPAVITSLCLCCDQLSDPKTPCDVSSHVLKELGHWWQRRVAEAGTDCHMTPGVYKTLVARFCGPATTVSVPCTCPPRVSVKTLGQAVWWTGECYTAVITLFPEQVHLLHTAPPTLFVTGPPGTGKTVVLLLMAIQWLRCGHHVYVVSTWIGSRAASRMLYHLLLQTVKTQQSAGVSPGQPHLLLYDLDGGKDVKKAVKDLSQAATGGSLYVIADEVVSEYSYTTNNFQTLYDKLLTQVPRLHLWAASCFHGHAPAGWQVEHLTRPLRSPPAVVREVQQDEWIVRDFDVKPYSERGVPDNTDGLPVTRLYHGGQGHSGRWPGDCVTCGREVASFLHSLRVGVTDSSTTLTYTRGGTTPPCLQWRDVLVLYWYDVSDRSGVVTGLQEAGIPVKVMTNDDIEDVATARSDVVWVTSGDRVRGLERKVVVCLQYPDYDLFTFKVLQRYNRSSLRLDLMSRCTSQLVIVCFDDKPPEDDRH